MKYNIQYIVIANMAQILTNIIYEYFLRTERKDLFMLRNSKGKFTRNENLFKKPYVEDRENMHGWHIIKKASAGYTVSSLYDNVRF